MFNTPATIKRLSYTSDIGSYATVSGVTLFGLFEPFDPQQAPIETQAGVQAYKFSTDGNAVVYASDIIVINSVEYQVKGLRRYVLGSLDFLDIILELGARN